MWGPTAKGCGRYEISECENAPCEMIPSSHNDRAFVIIILWTTDAVES